MFSSEIWEIFGCFLNFVCFKHSTLAEIDKQIWSQNDIKKVVSFDIEKLFQKRRYSETTKVIICQFYANTIF